MLVLKEISTKKLAVYISIIVLMLGGTGFMLYQNQKLTNRGASAINDSARYNNFMTVEVVAPGEATTTNQSLANSPQTEAELSQPPAANQTNNNSEIDSTIFSSEKFKELKENILIPQNSSAIGKRDPFQPN